jgi:predicted nucleic acid-binding protein
VSYLVDTTILSEVRKGARAHPRVVEWFAAVDADELFISVLSLGEIRRGIDAVDRRDRAGALALNRWFHHLVTHYERRILPIDLRVAEEWGRLTVARSLPTVDSLLAATARVHGLTVVTRNTKEVAPTGVPHLNPFAA